MFKQFDTGTDQCSRRGLLGSAAALAAGLALPARAGRPGCSAAGAVPEAEVRNKAAAEKKPLGRTLVRRKAVVSLINYRPIGGSKPDRLEKTLRRMSGNVAQAAAVGSDMTAFPEAVARLGSSDLWKFEGFDGPTVTAMRAAARDNSIYVVCPLPLVDNGVRRNSSVLIDRGGEIAGVYHKNFPTHGELDVGIIPGTETPVFETDFGRVGMSICFDLNSQMPEVSSDRLIEQFGLETMRAYLARARRDRKLALEGRYKPQPKS
jgi:hypothetical protein